jgi:amidohydrolase
MSHTGVDALAMANRVYIAIQTMLTRELDPFAQWVCSIGTMKAGKGYNSIADYAEMEGTIRTYSQEVDAYIIKRIEAISGSVAVEVGGKADVTSNQEMFPLYNDPAISKRLAEAMEKVVGAENVVPMKIKMSSEDFSHYLTKKPGAFFRLGTRNSAKGWTAVGHNNNFMLDEDALPLGARVLVRFVIDNMNGLRE